jgi:hypothetical protein
LLPDEAQDLWRWRICRRDCVFAGIGQVILVCQYYEIRPYQVKLQLRKEPVSGRVMEKRGIFCEKRRFIALLGNHEL